MKSTFQKPVSLLCFLLFLAACTSAANPAVEPTLVTVQLRWTHQAQFGGFYAADQNGYYANEGLQVKFIEGGAQVDQEAAVLNNQAQFGVLGADRLIMARAEGKPLQAIATIYRRSPIAFFALTDSGITHPQDFIGKSVRATKDIAPTLHAMMAHMKIPPNQYTEVDVSDPNLFYTGQVEVWSGFVNGAALTIQEAGYDLNFIFPDDYGVHFYADTIFTTDEFMAANPKLTTRFLRATLKGWTYAIENPNDIGPMVLKYNPQANSQLQTTSMIASLPLVNTGQDYVGWMEPAIWAEMEKTLREQNLLTMPLDISQVYTLQFLEAIYGETEQ